MSVAAAVAELRLRFKDLGAARGLEQAARRAERARQEAERATTQSNARQRTSYERLSLAREQLGMRSEHKIRREIQQTEAAYKRLANSGRLSQDELTRAAERTRLKVTQLTNEMGRLTREQQAAARAASQFETAQSRIRIGVAAGVGLAAGAYALKAPVQNAMNWQERLAYMANNAYSERDVTGRLAGAKELEAVVNKAVDSKRGGGGTREQAAEALEAMIARSVLGTQRSKDFLPHVMRVAYGNNAAPLDIANLSTGLVAQGVVSTEAELKTALNMITAAGEAGGFEIRDLARWLPEQLAVAKTGGYVGLGGLHRILTMNETSLLTASDTNQAGNNVANLLAKLNSSDSAKDFAKAGGGDLTEFLVKQQKKGVDTVTAWMGLIDRAIERDPVLKKAMAELNADKTLTKEQRSQRVDSIAQLTEGGVIGQFFQDRQARAALFSLRLKDDVARIDEYIGKNRTEYGANDINYQTLIGGGGAAVRNLEQELAIRQQQAMETLIPTITRAADMFADLSQKYPDLSAAVVGATPPVVAIGAAAGISAIALGGGAGGLAGAATLTASKLVSAAGLIQSAVIGYGIGTSVVKPAVDRAVQYFTGNDNATLGTAVYDWWNSPDNKRPDPTAKFEGELLLEITPGHQVRRAVAKIGDSTIGVTTKRNDTGNFHTGAPGSPR